MKKYVIVERQQSKYLYEIEKASYTPAGWREPYRYTSFPSLINNLVHPAEKRKPMVSLPGLNTYSNNVRLVDDTTCNEIDEIDRQIQVLRVKRQQIIYDRFLTFPLVKEGDLQRSHEKVYASKREAEGRILNTNASN